MEKGYTIYALVAKGVLVKIIEEENVKIQLDRPEEEVVDKGKEDSRLVFFISVLVGLILLTGIILFVIL